MDKPRAVQSRGRGRASSSAEQHVGRGKRQIQPGQRTETISAGPSQPTFAWGRQSQGGQAAATSGISVQPSCSTAAPQQRPRAPAVAGRASVAHPDEIAHQDAASGESSAEPIVVKEESRGAVRGKRVITEVVRSRPKTCTSKAGSVGKKIAVTANYFRLLKIPNWSIYQYRVDFSPDIDMIRLRRAYLNYHKSILGGFIFDGTILFSTNNLSRQMEHERMELPTLNREGETILIKIKYVGVVDPADIQQVQVLNLILRRAMEGLNLKLVGRNFFDPVAKIKLDNHRMEIWPGYTTSIRQHEQDVLLCTEIAHKIMRTETIYNIMTQCIRDSSDYQNAFKHEVVGMIVLTDYNNKTYRVDDVDFNTNPLATFSTKEGNVSFVEYYKKRYNITIRDAKQPLLVSRPTEKNIRGGNDDMIMLIPELARATGMTDAMRNNFKLMKDMSAHTRLVPERRIERLKMFNRRLQQAEESVAVLKLWNMKLDSNLVEIPARVLPPEKIVFGDQRRYVCDDNADWNREFRNTPMYTHTDIKRWYVIVPKRNIREVQEFVQLCIKAAQGMRMRISEPRYQEMPDDRNGSYSQAIDTAASQDPQILMLVLFNKNEEKYSCIKKKCCVDRPVPSQVVTLRVIAPRADRSSGLMSIATKVVIQMNAKLMGAPWMVELPLRGLMTIGFDVCHSAKDKNKSYGALVATMDMKTSTRYYSAVTPHMKGQELSNEVALNVTYALKAYREQHGCLPERILFFRDGVGDGQLHQVVNTELQYLTQKLDEIYKSAGVNAGCKMAFIVVSKRINTRYFVNRQNPVPGTVVDDIITLPERYDFFLVSQSVRQGTVSPTSYNVIFDTMGLNADKLQMLAYKMTHMYYNWSGTCRVPAVCQYAHKLAFLVAESIHRAPSNSLENQLYFL